MSHEDSKKPHADPNTLHVPNVSKLPLHHNFGPTSPDHVSADNSIPDMVTETTPEGHTVTVHRKVIKPKPLDAEAVKDRRQNSMGEIDGPH